MSDLKKQKRLKNPSQRSLILRNVKLARKMSEITAGQIRLLEALTEEFKLSLVLGDLKLLDSKWYVTYSGLLRVARRNRCAGIQVHPVREFSDPAQRRWVFCATVHRSRMSEPFVGYGDADPSNVSLLVQGAEMRIAETRAVNRALRKAYGIGICSVEELGSCRDANTPSQRSQE